MKKMVVAGPGEGNEMDRMRTAEMEYCVDDQRQLIVSREKSDLPSRKIG